IIDQPGGEIPPEDTETGDGNEPTDDDGFGGGSYDDPPTGGGEIINDPPAKYYVHNVEVKVINHRVYYYDKDGKLITESL
ncbi:hypothetical protein, partial [Klebsiella pneumoniae]